MSFMSLKLKPNSRHRLWNVAKEAKLISNQINEFKLLRIREKKPVDLLLIVICSIIDIWCNKLYSLHKKFLLLFFKKIPHQYLFIIYIYLPLALSFCTKKKKKTSKLIKYLVRVWLIDIQSNIYMFNNEVN